MGGASSPLLLHVSTCSSPAKSRFTFSKLISQSRKYFRSCYRSNHKMAPTPMDFFDLANLLDNDGNLQNEMMVASFAATMLATIPVLLGNEFDVNVGLKKRKKREEEGVEDVGGKKVGGNGEMGEEKSGRRAFL